MPRRKILTPAQTDALFGWPTSEADLVRHYTLAREDLEVVATRRGDPNRLGFALQLCVLRHPGRLLRSGEVIPEEVLTFVGDQIGVAEACAVETYAARPETRREHLGVLRQAFDFSFLGLEHRRTLLEWLLPVAARHDERVRPGPHPDGRAAPASDRCGGAEHGREVGGEGAAGGGAPRGRAARPVASTQNRGTPSTRSSSGTPRPRISVP